MSEKGQGDKEEQKGQGDKEEQRRSRINPGQEELKLSQSCEQLLELYYRTLRMISEEDEVKFWDSFKQFYNHANKSKGRYKIEYLVDRITKLKANVESAWQKKQTYAESGFGDLEREYNNKVLLLFASIINEVENIKEKSLEIEGKKTEKISAKWAGQILNAYFKVILHLGALNHIIYVAMLYDMQMPNTYRLNLMHQQRTLLRIRKEIEKLTPADAPQDIVPPEDIIKNITTVAAHVKELADIYKAHQEKIYDVEGWEEISSRIDELELQSSILDIYRATLDKVFSP